MSACDIAMIASVMVGAILTIAAFAAVEYVGARKAPSATRTNRTDYKEAGELINILASLHARRGSAFTREEFDEIDRSIQEARERLELAVVRGSWE